MLGRTRTFSKLYRIELQRCYSLSSPPPPPEFTRVHYPAGSGGRKSSVGRDVGQINSAQIDRVLKVRTLHVRTSVAQGFFSCLSVVIDHIHPLLPGQ